MSHADQHRALEPGITAVAAANDDAGPDSVEVQSQKGALPAVVAETAGWDAYHVWRTRIRDPRLHRDR